MHGIGQSVSILRAKAEKMMHLLEQVPCFLRFLSFFSFFLFIMRHAFRHACVPQLVVTLVDMSMFTEI